MTAIVRIVKRNFDFKSRVYSCNRNNCLTFALEANWFYRCPSSERGKSGQQRATRFLTGRLPPGRQKVPQKINRPMQMG